VGAAKFRDFDYADAMKAIAAHRESPHVTENKGFIDWGQLMEGCRAAVAAREQSRDNSRREGSWCDVYRRQRPDLKDSADVEVVMHVHRGWWLNRKCSQTDGYRRMFARRARAGSWRWASPPRRRSWRRTRCSRCRADFERAVTDLVDNVRPATLALPAPA
jgi:hypothetical protein